MIGIENYYKYTDTETKKALKSIVILCDTREQQNTHITTEFDNLKIEHTNYKLDIGDYNAMLPCMPELNINRPIYFDRSIVIERKGSLDELASNFTNDRERLHDEFTRAKAADAKIYLVIEDSKGYDNILKHNYRSKLTEKALLASLLAFQQRYNINITFLDKEYIAIYIYNILYYHIRNIMFN